MMFVKTMYYLKLFPGFGFMVTMVKDSVIKSIEFVLFFILWLVFFTTQYKILGVVFDGCDYGLGNFTNILVTTLRISTGDLQVPTVDENKYLNISIQMTWIFHIIFMFIIMMNFVIAVIGEAYTSV